MRRIVAIVLGAILALGMFGSVQATDPESCSQASYSVWEYNNYVGDGLHVCYPVNFSNLANNVHLQAGLCYSLREQNHPDTWDNCLSSTKSYVGSENYHWVCFFTGANYTGTQFTLLPTGSVNFNTTMNDAITSIKWC